MNHSATHIRLYILRETPHRPDAVEYWSRRSDSGIWTAPETVVMVSEQPVEAAMRLYAELAAAAGMNDVPPDTYRRRGVRQGAWHFETAAASHVAAAWPDTQGCYAWQEFKVDF